MLLSLFLCKPLLASPLSDTTQILSFAEKMPVFPGGDSAMFAFINSNLLLPESLKNDTVKGTVFASFVVKYSGKITDATIVRGLKPDLDKEVLRVITNMPAWTPAEHNGKKVNVRYTIPVKFAITPKNRINNKITSNQPGISGFDDQIHPDIPEKKSSDKNKEKVYEAGDVDRMPSYPGGTDNMLKHLAQKVNYPRSAMKDKVTGTVFVCFIVERDGSITDIEVTKGVREDLDKTVIQAVSTFPTFIPGEKNGEKVRVKFKIPVRFSAKY